MARKKKIPTTEGQPWYYDYLMSRCREIFKWSPERKKALKRAQISKSPELWECEECGKFPLVRNEKEVDHTEPCENVNGFDGWTNTIRRTIEAPSELIGILCKPCHYKKSARENAARRAAKNGPKTNNK